MDRKFQVWVAHWDVDLMAVAVMDMTSHGVVEFRGPSFEHDGWSGSPAAVLHDSLEGWHASVLHADGVLDVLPWHPDFDSVAALFDAT